MPSWEVKLHKMFAKCPKCKSERVDHCVGEPRMTLSSSGGATMTRMHYCQACANYFYGPEEKADATDVLEWVVTNKYLREYDKGCMVTIKQRGTVVATVQIETNDMGDGMAYRKQTKNGTVDGELPDEDGRSAIALLRDVLNDIIKKENAA